jgi:hypothetical protein
MCKTSAAGMDGARGPVHELKSRRFERFSKGVATFDGNFCHCPTALIPTRPSVARSACRVVRAYSVPHLGGLRTVNRPPLCSVSLSGPRYGARNSNAAPSRRRSPAPLCARTREPGPTLRRGRTNVDRSHQALGKTGLERAAMTATAAPGDSDKRRATPTSDERLRQATSDSDKRRATPTSDERLRRATSDSDERRATPTSVQRLRRATSD